MGQESAGVQAIAFDVVGLPAPQGSKSFKGMRTSKATGKSHAVLVESSKKVKPWRKAVEEAARAALDKQPDRVDILGNSPDTPLFDGPLRVRMVFTVPKPKNAPKTRRTYPDRMPDGSKLQRSTEDALTDAGLIADDARIVEWSGAKRYPGEGEDALDAPGARIFVEAIT